MFVLACAASTASAIEVTGKVIGSQGEKVVVEIETASGIQRGDTVLFSTEVAGRKLEAGRGTVIRVGQDEVDVSLSSGRANVGMSARIELQRFVHECDTIAAIPDDLNAVAQGVYPEMLDTARAISVCREATKLYPEEARFHAQLGRSYMQSDQMGRAILSFERAIGIQPDYAAALHNLASILHFGPEELRNDPRARSYFLKAAEQDFYASMPIIGTMCRHGIGGEINHEVSAYWFSQAAENDDPSAQNALAECYENGWGLEKDLTSALIWYRSSAEQKHPPALRNMGRVFHRGIGVERNPQRAITWYEEAASLGDAEARYTLSNIFIEGIDALRDTSKAFDLLKLSAKSEYLPALKKLSEIHLQGTLVKRDYDQAAGYLKQAALLGDPAAQYQFGAMAEKGQGTDRDKNLAIEMYRRAARQDHAKAQERLTRLKQTW